MRHVLKTVIILFIMCYSIQYALAEKIFDIAHINEQGQDMIIIPLNNEFGYKSSSEQKKIAESFQYCASSAGLRGIVVIVWDSKAFYKSLNPQQKFPFISFKNVPFGNYFNFLGPTPWHPFLESIGMGGVMLNLNKRLTCQ